MSLSQYKRKRNLSKSKEPKAVRKSTKEGRIFVLQKHYAKTTHFDLRFELNGVLKSWAVPKGVSRSTKDKRLAIQTEDHPLDYAKFEGSIPKGHYGAGEVDLVDTGKYYNVKIDENGKLVSLRKCFKEGYLELYLSGRKIKGPYALFHFKEKNWFLVKMNEPKLKKKFKELGVLYPNS